jgi:hypothetical protein
MIRSLFFVFAVTVIGLSMCNVSPLRQQGEGYMRLDVSDAVPLSLYSPDSVVLGIWMSEGVSDWDGVKRNEFLDVMFLKDSTLYFAFYEAQVYADTFVLLNVIPYRAYTSSQGLLLVCEQTGHACLMRADSMLYNYGLDDSLLYDVSPKVSTMQAVFAARHHYRQQCRQNDSLTLVRVNMPSEDTFYLRIYQRYPSMKYYLQIFTPTSIRKDFLLKDSTLIDGNIQFNDVTKTGFSQYLRYHHLRYHPSDSVLRIYRLEQQGDSVSSLLVHAMPKVAYNYRTTTFDSLFYYGLPVQRD